MVIHIYIYYTANNKDLPRRWQLLETPQARPGLGPEAKLGRGLGLGLGLGRRAHLVLKDKPFRIRGSTGLSIRL